MLVTFIFFFDNFLNQRKLPAYCTYLPAFSQNLSAFCQNLPTFCQNLPVFCQNLPAFPSNLPTCYATFKILFGLKVISWRDGGHINHSSRLLFTKNNGLPNSSIVLLFNNFFSKLTLQAQSYMNITTNTYTTTLKQN